MFNQKLFHARLGKGWSPEEASEQVGVSLKTYLRWEAGTHLPQAKTFGFLLRAFGERPGRPAKPEDLGFIVDGETGHIRFMTAADEILAREENPEKPKEGLALAYEEVIESLQRSLMLPLGRDASGQEAAEIDKLMRVALSILAPSLNMAVVGVAMWLCDRANKLKAIGTCGQRITVQQYLTIAYAEIESWKRLIDEDSQPTELYRTTRRTVIGSLALFPSSFLVATQFWPMSDAIAQGFVTQCAPCIMACSYLLKGDGLAAVEYALPQYLPQLVRLAKSPSPVQKEAAYLAAQGLCLMGTVKFHRRRLSELVTHCQKAVELAKVTGDRVLVAAAYTNLQVAYYFSGKPEKGLEACQEAERLIPKEAERLLLAKDPALFPARLQHQIYMGLSNFHALFGHVQEAELYLGMARALPVSFDDDVFIPALDYDLSHKVGLEGQLYGKLGKLEAPDPDKPLSKEARKLYEQADAAYGQPFPELADVVERVHIQNLIERAEIATILGNKEEFKQYFTEGALRAQELESKARLSEARKAWRAACGKWRGDEDVENLDELLE